MVTNLEIKIRNKCIRSSGSNRGLMNGRKTVGEGRKDNGGEVNESPLVPQKRDSSPSLGWLEVPHHISVPGQQIGPQAGLWPKPEHGQLQSACRPPCRWVFTPRSSSLELGLTLSEYKLGDGSGKRGENGTRGRNDMHRPRPSSRTWQEEGSGGERWELRSRQLVSSTILLLLQDLAQRARPSLSSLCSVTAEAGVGSGGRA